MRSATADPISAALSQATMSISRQLDVASFKENAGGTLGALTLQSGANDVALEVRRQIHAVELQHQQRQRDPDRTHLKAPMEPTRTPLFDLRRWPVKFEQTGSVRNRVAQRSGLSSGGGEHKHDDHCSPTCNGFLRSPSQSLPCDALTGLSLRPGYRHEAVRSLRSYSGFRPILCALSRSVDRRRSGQLSPGNRYVCRVEPFHNRQRYG